MAFRYQCKSSLGWSWTIPGLIVVFQDMKADHIMQSVDIAPNHLHNIIKETPRPPVPSVRRGKQNTPSDAEDSDAAFDPTCIDYGLETSRSPRPHRPDLKIHSTAIQPSKRKLTHHQAGKDVRDEEYEDDEEEVAEGEDEDDEDEDEEDEDEDDEDDEEEEAEEDVGLVFGESEDDGSIRPGKDSKRSKKQGRRAAYDAPVAAMVNYTTPQHQKTNYLKRSASTGGTEGRSLAKNRRKTTMDVSPRGRHKAPNPRRRKQTPPLKSPDYDWNYRT